MRRVVMSDLLRMYAAVRLTASCQRIRIGRKCGTDAALSYYNFSVLIRCNAALWRYYQTRGQSQGVRKAEIVDGTFGSTPDGLYESWRSGRRKAWGKPMRGR